MAEERSLIISTVIGISILLSMYVCSSTRSQGYVTSGSHAMAAFPSITGEQSETAYECAVSALLSRMYMHICICIDFGMRPNVQRIPSRATYQSSLPSI